MYMNIYEYIYVYLYIYDYLSIYICVCLSIYMFIYLSISIYIRMFILYIITRYGSYPGANAAGAWGRNSESSHNHPRLLVGQKNIIFATSKQHSESFIILLNYHQAFPH